MAILNNKIIKVFTSIAAVFSLSAIAADKAPGSALFDAFDKNNDGAIDPGEFVERQNRDISAAKAKSLGAGMPSKVPSTIPNKMPSFVDIDRDHNNLISREEFEKIRPFDGGDYVKRREIARNKLLSFSDFDLNGDAKLEKEEFYQARSARIKERSESGYPMGRISNAPSFEQIDTNKDSIIDENEFLAHQKKAQNIHRSMK